MPAEDRLDPSCSATAACLVPAERFGPAGRFAPDARLAPAERFAPDGRPLGLVWTYTPRELLADGVVHVLGVTLALAGALALVVSAALVHLGPAEQAAVGIYAAGLVSMLSVSAAYNMWPVGPLKWR